MEESTKKMTRNTLRVAAVQVTSENGRVYENLRHATGYVEEAAVRGAELVLLPELMPAGYVFTQDFWDGGEPGNGPTVKWLKDTSKRLGIWLGTSFLEAKGHDFYNTFVLANPDGEEDGRVRKQTPAFAEAYFFRGEVSTHVINTRLGKIGVAICYDNLFAYTPRYMYEQSVDLLLQPHASPALTASRLISEKSAALLRTTFEKRAQIYAGMLGIPVIYCNHSGRLITPVPGMPCLKQDTVFAGLSSIADSDGTLKAQIGSEEGVVVADVILSPDRKSKLPPTTYGMWSMPYIHWTRKNRSVETMGRIWYQFSKERRRRAMIISQDY